MPHSALLYITFLLSLLRTNYSCICKGHLHIVQIVSMSTNLLGLEDNSTGIVSQSNTSLSQTIKKSPCLDYLTSLWIFLMLTKKPVTFSFKVLSVYLSIYVTRLSLWCCTLKSELSQLVLSWNTVVVFVCWFSWLFLFLILHFNSLESAMKNSKGNFSLSSQDCLKCNSGLMYHFTFHVKNSLA